MSGVPAYMRVRNYVVDIVRTAQDPAVRIMSEREICAKFGLTRPTVRRALKDLIDDGWLIPRPGLGTFIHPYRTMNESSRIRKPRRILFVVGDGRHVDLDPLDMGVLSSLCNVLPTLNSNLKLVNLYLPPERMAEDLSAHNPDGVIWLRPPEKFQGFIESCRSNFPVHVLGCVALGRLHSTTMDYRKAGRLAAAWFLDRGCRNVAFIGNNEHETGGVRIRDALRTGWLEEFAARNLSCDDDLFIPDNEDIAGGLTSLLRRRQLDGVFSFSMFFAIISPVLAGAAAGKDFPVMVDDDYSFLDNLPVRPSVKLLIFPPELVSSAARRLYESIENPSRPCPELVLQPSIREG